MQEFSLGSVPAFQMIVDRHWARTMIYARQLTGDPDAASDATQEAFFRLWKVRATWRPIGSVQAWLLRTVRNYVMSEARAIATRTKALEKAGPELTAAQLTPLEDAERAELMESIRRAVASLPPRRREAFTLFHVHHLSYRQIAELMNVRPQTVANYLQAAVSDLRVELSNHFPELSGSGGAVQEAG